jgi:hypothetical protein
MDSPSVSRTVARRVNLKKTMTVIELSGEQAAALKAKAAAAGLTLEAWLKQLAGVAETEPVEHPLQTAAEIVLGRMRKVPPEIMATMPKDGASQHDHYIYHPDFRPLARHPEEVHPSSDLLGNLCALLILPFSIS